MQAHLQFQAGDNAAAGKAVPYTEAVPEEILVPGVASQACDDEEGIPPVPLAPSPRAILPAAMNRTDVRNTACADAYDVLVVGAGHAGCEAALAASRMGGRVAACTLSREKVAEMPCNPAIGGLAKSHLVREIDALGGAMGRVIDRTGIQFRTLNRGKGPAVQAPRAQADKQRYRAEMRRVLERARGLDLVEAEVTGIRFDGNRVSGAELAGGGVIPCRAVIVTTGTFLYGLMHIGEKKIIGGRRDERRTAALSDCLRALGIRLGRFKTGTPTRLHRDTIRYDRTEVQEGEDPPPAFSHFTRSIDRPQVCCYLTRTNEATHDVIRANLDRSPLYSGRIQGVGPRYCPSIEDKVVKFPDKDGHQVFLEPEGIGVEEIYVNGMSTSMPEDVQAAMIATVPGLEGARILRFGYAVEYDCVFPTQLSRHLMLPDYPGLFFAGQINGTSGYEEAAAQGLMAGINAMRYVRGEVPVILGRSDAYIGVLIDDLVTRGTEEPYRMFTSQAEYRLLLRCDNAGDRLGERARSLGLLTDAEADLLLHEREATRAALGTLASTPVPPEARMTIARERGLELEARGVSWQDLLRRPQFSYADLVRFGLDGTVSPAALGFPLADPERVARKVEIEILYEGYVKRMLEEVARSRTLENKPIPPHLLDAELAGISTEAMQKLRAVRPETFGQARRISGVTPSTLSVLLVYVERWRRVTSPNDPPTTGDPSRPAGRT